MVKSKITAEYKAVKLAVTAGIRGQISGHGRNKAVKSAVTTGYMAVKSAVTAGYNAVKSAVTDGRDL